MFTLPGACAETALGQSDLFRGIFESEEPVFHTTILPRAGTEDLRLVVYFTHSKLDALEASIWVKDHGTTMADGGPRQLVRGLQTLGNRRPDTILVRNLANLHFYTFGIDYRNPRALSGKFTPAVLQSGYRYEAAAPPAPAGPPPRLTAAAPPCEEPVLTAGVAPAGYCGADNRPAIQLQCRNCEERNWAFSVEVRTETDNWRPLRADGQQQPAFGLSLRTEPLCILRPGIYHARVLAWAAGCPTPVTFNLPTPVVITDPAAPAYAAAPAGPKATPAPPRTRPSIPDTCEVYVEATLTGNIISGLLEMPLRSPCGAYYPYAELRYVHPGYRDITSEPILLTAGELAPFEIRLDERDLSRSIHPIQVVVYVRPEAPARGVPVASFWIRPDSPANRVAEGSAPANRPETATRGLNAPSPSLPGYPSGIDETMLHQSIDTIGVKASDPNCNQIQDLKLYYDPMRQQQPVFISWLSPRCCQIEGCNYSVWAGKSFDQLRLIVRGRKPGAVIKELLSDLNPDDEYYEVVVETANGPRKAAYVTGEGPKYGIDAITDYHDRIKAPASDSLAFARETAAVPPPPAAGQMADRGVDTGAAAAAQAGGAEFRWDDPGAQASDARPGPPADAAAGYARPRVPISNFEPCRYQRETQLSGDQPARVGARVTIRYDYDERDYRYTLYFQPTGSADWVLAPGTEELQASPAFTFTVTPRHAGKYLVLARKNGKNWGCLSAPLSAATPLSVTDGE